MSTILAKEIVELRTEVAELKVMVQTLLDRKEEKKTYRTNTDVRRKAKKHRYPQASSITPLIDKSLAAKLSLLKPPYAYVLKYDAGDLWNEEAFPQVPKKATSAPPKHHIKTPIYTPA